MMKHFICSVSQTETRLEFNALQTEILAVSDGNAPKSQPFSPSETERMAFFVIRI
jgi:hypothetical protein